MIDASASRLSRSTGHVATEVASRISRRSFIGRVGKLALVTAGGSAVLAFLADPAYALLCNCEGPDCSNDCGNGRPDPGGCDQFSHSVTCAALGFSGVCPNTTVQCGFWFCYSCSACGGGTRKWTDCCETGHHCDNQSDCDCIKDVDDKKRPTCCHRRCYDQQHQACDYIRCRFADCV